MSSKDLPQTWLSPVFAWLCNDIHDPQICPNIKLKAVNEIHSPMMTFMTHLTQVTVSEGLDRGQRLTSSLACQLLQNFWLQISAPLPTLNCLNTMLLHAECHKPFQLGKMDIKWNLLLKLSKSGWKHYPPWKLEFSVSRVLVLLISDKLSKI